MASGNSIDNGNASLAVLPIARGALPETTALIGVSPNVGGHITDRLHLVSHLVADLRRAGRTRGLLDEVYRRLADDALAGRDDLAESLAEMRGGEGRVVRSATTTP